MPVDITRAPYRKKEMETLGPNRLKRKFGTAAILKFRYTYKNKYALRGYVMRYVMTR